MKADKPATLFLLLALAGAACKDSGPPAGPPTDPGSGRWFGTIVVEAVTHTNEVNMIQGGASTNHDQEQRWVTTITIADTGARTATASWSVNDTYVTDITIPCYHQRATALSNATGDAASQGPLGYVSLAADGGGSYRSTEFPGVIQAGPMIDTRNHVTTTVCGGGLVQDSVNATGWPLFSVLPMDHIKGTLDADKRTAKGSTSFDDQSTHYSMHWTLKRDKEIVAKVGGPYRVARADQVTLDGSKSRGDIDSYTWTVTPSEACANMGNKKIAAPQSIGKEVDHDGKTFQFAVLCPVDIHLTVRGKAGTDEDDGVVMVDPRKTKVEFNDPAMSTESFPAGQAGANRCALEPTAPSGHYIHADDPSWKGSAYTAKEITQADSPFAGAFYVATQKLFVARSEQVNVEWLAPQGSTYKENILPAHDNKPVADRLVAQAKAHEAAHSKLLKGWLDFVAGTSLDASVPLEGYAAMDEASLDLAAKTWLDDADADFCLSTTHPYVQGELAGAYGDNVTIYLPTGEKYVGPFNLAGDEKLPCE